MPNSMQVLLRLFRQATPAPSRLDSEDATCCEIALDVFDVDLDPSGQGLWSALEECCAAVAARPGQKRRVEVSFRKLGPADREKISQGNEEGVAKLARE